MAWCCRHQTCCQLLAETEQTRDKRSCIHCFVVDTSPGTRGCGQGASVTSLVPGPGTGDSVECYVVRSRHNKNYLQQFTLIPYHQYHNSKLAGKFYTKKTTNFPSFPVSQYIVMLTLKTEGAIWIVLQWKWNHLTSDASDCLQIW